MTDKIKNLKNSVIATEPEEVEAETLEQEAAEEVRREKKAEFSRKRKAVLSKAKSIGKKVGIGTVNIIIIIQL